MRRAKIVATVGPSSNDEKTLSRMIKAGLDVARLNMSHGNHASHAQVIKLIRKISKEIGKEVGILLDLAGPKIRLGELCAPLILHMNDEITLTTIANEGDNEKMIIPVAYADLAKELKKGDLFSMVDGAIHLKTLSTDGKRLLACVRPLWGHHL
jgi:pyruvate kinase